MKIWTEKWWLGCLLMFIVLTGCSSDTDQETESVELTVSAAASLLDSMNAIADRFEAQHPKIKLAFNFAASGTLQHQIEQGANVDLFLSAGMNQMDRLIESGHVNESDKEVILVNEMVLIVPKGQQNHPSSITELLEDDFEHISIGQPEMVPAGAYAKTILEYYNVWEALQEKIVFGKDVRQVLSYVETGNVDAALVYKTDALISDEVELAFTIDSESYSAVEYPIGIVKTTEHRPEVEMFYHYLFGEEAQTIFEQYGFSIPQ